MEENMKRTIWSNEGYSDWEKEMKKEEETSDYTIDYDGFCDFCNDWLFDEKANLKYAEIPVGYTIVAYAKLGLWHGLSTGYKVVGTDVSEIVGLHGCDLGTLYCDDEDVRFDGAHHDGDNNVLFRLVKEDDRDEVCNAIYNGMTESEFIEHSKSLRDSVAEVYGW